MSPSRRSRLVLLGAGLVLFFRPAPVVAVPVLSVAGSVEASPESLDVRVDVSNGGDAKAAPVSVDGELFGRHDAAQLEKGIGPGETRSVLLRYPLSFPRPGLHPLLLLLEYQQPSGETVSQRAFLILALGANPKPAVRLTVPPASLQDEATLSVSLESADAAPHAVRLRVATPKGLRADAPVGEIAVPAQGRAWAAIRLLRGAAPRQTVQGLLVVAAASEGDVERTSIETGVVNVLPDPAWLPRLRRPLLVLAVILLAAAVAAEIRRKSAASRA